MFEQELDKKIKETRNEYTDLQNKNIIKDGINIAFIMFPAVLGGAMLVTGNLGLGLGLLSLAGGSISNRYRIKENYFSSVARYQQELKHLRETSDREETKETVKRKSCKLFALIGKQKELEEKYDATKTGIIITNMITVIGALGVIISKNPSGIWMPLIGVTSSFFVNYEAVKQFKVKELIKNRCDNLENDLELEAARQEDKNNIEYNENKKEKKETKNIEKSKERIPDYYYDGFDEPVSDKTETIDKPKKYIKK